MTGKLRGVHRLTPWHFIKLLFVVALGVCLTALVLGLKTEKEHTATDHVWVPGNATSIYDLFGYLQFRSGFQDSVFWKDTHTFGEYQKLDASANFFVLVDGQIRYLAVLRNADGTVSVARTKVSPKIPKKGFWETRIVSFDLVTGQVTAQYARALDQVIYSAVAPFLLWLLVSILMGMARGLKWSEPVFPLKRAPP